MKIIRINPVVSALLASAVGLSVSSCDDVLKVSRSLEAGKETSLEIGVSIAPVQTNSEAPVTKASRGVVSNVYGSEEDGFCITEYVSDIDAAPLRTKGWEITSSNISAKYGELDVAAWMMPEASAGATSAPEQHISQNLVFDSIASPASWSWSGEAPMWIADTPLSIWSYAPSTIPGDVKPAVNTSVTDASGDLFPELNTFSYTVPADFQAQKDLLFAYNVEARHFNETDSGYEVDPNNGVGTRHNGKFDSKFDVRFYHALAAVKFVLAPEEGTSGLAAGTKTISKNTNVRKITLSGVLDSGTCAVSGSGTGAGTVSFVWTPGSTTKDFVYEYDESDPKLLGRRGGSTGFCSAEDGVLFMIPQNLSDVTITVEFMKFNNPSSTVTRTRAISTSKWEAGKYYVYEFAGEVHVPGEAIDTVEWSFKGFKNAASGEVKLFGDVKNTAAAKIKGVTKIGLYLSKQQFVDSAGKSSADLFVTNSDGSKSSRSITTPYSYDFKPLNTTPVNGIYSWGDGTVESYLGLNSISKTEATGIYYVFDVTDYNTFDVVCKIVGDANNARWTGSISHLIVLEVEND